jgi:hypothetical protein
LTHAHKKHSLYAHDMHFAHAFSLCAGHLLLPALSNPLLILLLLALDVPEPPPALAFATNTTIKSQKRIRVALTQDFFSFSRVVALSVPSFP